MRCCCVLTHVNRGAPARRRLSARCGGQLYEYTDAPPPQQGRCGTGSWNYSATFEEFPMKSPVNPAVALCGMLSLSGLAGPGFAQTVPTSYSWASTGPIIGPKSDSTHNIIAVKDPSAVLFNGRWVIYASDVNSAGNYNMEYLNVAS